MATTQPRSLVLLLALALALSLPAAPSRAAMPWSKGAAEPSGDAATSSGGAAATKPGSAPQAKPAEPAPAPAPTMKETMAQIARIAEELKQIDGRLQHLEKSVAGIDQSMGPVGNALKAEALRDIMNEAGDVAYDRARSLLLLAAACVAALIVLYAVVRRWILPPARASVRKGD